MSDTLSALSLLTALLDARTTTSRLSHIQSISQLTLVEFDSILYQLINLSTLFLQSNLTEEHHAINQSIESMCATSAHLSIKCKWLCDAVAVTFKPSIKQPKDQLINQSIYQSIDQLSKSVEAAYVNGKYVKASVLQSMIPDSHSINESINLRSHCLIDPKGEIDIQIEPQTNCSIESNDIETSNQIIDHSSHQTVNDSIHESANGTTSQSANKLNQDLIDLDADVMFALSKKQRNDYFDSINQMIYQFNEAGQTLINQPIDQRQTVVKKLIQSINQSAKHLYIPAQPSVIVKERNRWHSAAQSTNHSSSQTPSSSARASINHSITDSNPLSLSHNLAISQSINQSDAQSVLPITRHYVIDRLIASQSVALSSKSRAPFLVCAEIHYTGREVYDPLIYQEIDESNNQSVNQLNNQTIELDQSTNQQIKRAVTEPDRPLSPGDLMQISKLSVEQSAALHNEHRSPSSNSSASRRSKVPLLTPPGSIRPRSLSEAVNHDQPLNGKSVTRANNRSNEHSINQTQPGSRNRPPLHMTAPSSPATAKKSVNQPSTQLKPTRRQSNLDQMSTPLNQSVKRSNKQSTVEYLRSLPFSVLDAAFGPNWQHRKQQIRQRSRYANQSNNQTNNHSNNHSNIRSNNQSNSSVDQPIIDQSNSRSTDHDWDLISFLIKGQDPAIAQELLASQLINVCRSVFEQANNHTNNQSNNQSIYLKNLSINLSGPDSAIVEAIVDASSIDSIKRKLNIQSISDFFIAYFTHPQHPENKFPINQTIKQSSNRPGLATSQSSSQLNDLSISQSMSQPAFQSAYQNYLSSIVGYSLITYVLSVRDRHNGNIMIDRSGHITHIDFGFLLGNSPGRNMNFENCPFKMTDEFWEIIKSMDSDQSTNQSFGTNRFTALFELGFMSLRARWTEIIALIRPLANARLPCFEVNSVADAISGIRTRLCVDASEADARARARACVAESVGHWRSQQYDLLQYYTNSIH